MAAERWVNDSGTARRITQRWVNDNGVARQIMERWVNDNGVARCVYQAVTVSLSNTTVNRADGGSPAEFYLQNDGNIMQRVGSSLTDIGDWINNASHVSEYEVRATVTSGSVGGSATGSWLSLASTQSWSRGAALSSIQTAVLLIEIRRASDATVVASATVTIICDRT